MSDPDEKYLIKGPQPEPKPEEVSQVPAGFKPKKVEIRKGFDKDGKPIVSAMTTLSQVNEEHIYILYQSYAKQAVIECDLLGDQAVHKSDGKLPPVIHIECPKCTGKEDKDRSVLSITHGNKHFEIEPLPQKDWGVVTMPDGRPVTGSDGKPAIVTKRLTIKEAFKCSYCGSRFRITDNIMSDS